MQGSDEKLTHKQELAIAALLSEATVSAAASKARVNEVTLYRWLQQEVFLGEYRAARRVVLEKAYAQLQQSSWAASTTLLKLLASSNDSVRLRAAQAILDHAGKGVELLDFEGRLVAVEQFAKDAGKSR